MPEDPAKKKARRASYYASHKDAENAAARKWQRDHADHVRQRQAEYRATHKELYKALNAKWIYEHPDREKDRKADYWREHGDAERARNAAYKRARPEQRRATEAKRRASKMAADVGGVTTEFVSAQLTGQGNRCWWCGKKLPKTGWHMDHRIPLSKGGEHGPANIVIACQHCNQSKRAKTPVEFCGRLL